MAKDAYHELFLHVVWHTKGSRNLIPLHHEQQLHDVIRRRALAPGGVYVHAIGGTRDHVHLVARVRPSLLISEWIGRVKGGSSHDINENAHWRLTWQAGYGVVTFGAKDLEWACEYVRRQKEHHYAGTVFDRLERVGVDETASDLPAEAGG
jgi:putative transposase